jgi:single-strand DNA-binding protein
MADFNKVILIGRLTRDPELKYTPSGAQVAKFGLAVGRRSFKKDEGRKEETDFIDIVAWQKLAEICGQYLKKGRLVLIEGRIQTRRYETQDGQKRSAFEVVAENMQMLESKKAVAEGGGSYAAPARSNSSYPPDLEELTPDDLGVDEFDAADMPF